MTAVIKRGAGNLLVPLCFQPYIRVNPYAAFSTLSPVVHQWRQGRSFMDIIRRQLLKSVVVSAQLTAVTDSVFVTGLMLIWGEVVMWILQDSLFPSW